MACAVSGSHTWPMTRVTTWMERTSVDPPNSQSTFIGSLIPFAKARICLFTRIFRRSKFLNCSSVV